MRLSCLILGLLATVATAGGGYIPVPAGEFRSVLKREDVKGNTRVSRVLVMRQPVTNAEFLSFVRQHPQWQRGRTPGLFAESSGYLSHWAGATDLGVQAKPLQPVTQVSWFAASAFCEAQAARLPTWSEWEYVAAADETRRDARQDPAWRERILGWYGQNAARPLGLVGQSPANVYGVQDLHGLIWEWTEDYAAMLVSSDSRNQSEEDRLKFCGAGALSVDDRENYPVMMRVALLSSVKGSDTTSSLGFRCAKDVP